MLKHAIISLMVACFFVCSASPARAELTKQEIIDYNDRYKELYAQCNIDTFVAYLQKHFHPGYKARLRLPTGQTIIVDKAQLVDLYATTLKSAKQNGEVLSSCNVDSDILDISTDGDQGVVTIQQREKASFPVPAGGMQEIRILTVCNHLVEKKNGQLLIMSSSCVSKQEL